MTFDIPHLISAAVIIFVELWGLGQMTLYESMSKGRTASVTFVVLFVALMTLNFVWPYGSGA
ncbi:hypothetical protein AAFN47_04380 [Hoeflea sp. CAU 1731]